MSRGTCICGKRQYSTKAKARASANSFRKDTGDQMHAYKCPFDTRLWHIGHRRGPIPRTRALARAAIERSRGRA